MLGRAGLGGRLFCAVDLLGERVDALEEIGQALLEGAYYDEAGQPLTASYMAYAIPRADDLPSFQLDRTVTPCPHNPLGAKGAGDDTIVDADYEEVK